MGRYSSRGKVRKTRKWNAGPRALAESLEGRLYLATIYVDVGAVGTSQDGKTWETAFVDLQPGLAAAKSGDRILVAGGTYRPGTSRAATFQLRTGVSLLGGYAGSGAANPDTRDSGRYPSILSGDIGKPGDAGDNSYHVVTGSGGIGSTAALDGFTITGGNASGTTAADRSGAGLYLSAGSPTIINCAFIGNSADTSGGGIYVASSSSPAITNCTFASNRAFTSGGAIFVSSSSPVITNCTLAGNLAGSSGGAIAYASASPRLANSILWGNWASYGPQVYYSGTTTTITYCDIQGGYAGTGNINADPLFVHCGPGPDATWGTADDDYSDLRLRLSSPAIDAGNSSAISIGITTDLAGNPRRKDIAAVKDTGSGVPIVDMGAYEAQPQVQAVSGGPYVVMDGNSVSLQGAGYSERNLKLTYAWDLDDDGVFDDASIPNPTLSLAGRTGPLTLNIALRVTDSANASVIDRTTVRLAQAVYVDDSATGANNGTSWADAYASLQSALVVATSDQFIRVAQGTYQPTTGVDRTISFQLKSGVAIYGGYAGNGSADPDARDITRYPTILSGDIGVIGRATDNSYHVVNGSGTDSTAVLDGFTITGGNANGTSALTAQGGGMYNSRGNATVRNCTFSGNLAGSTNAVGSNNGGGGMYSSYASPTIANCTFIGNSVVTSNSNSGGGGMYLDYSSPTLVDCAFSANTAGSTRYSNSGGGLYIASNSSPKLINCDFVGNVAYGWGGGVSRNMDFGIADATAQPALVNCTFAGNSATFSGGGVYDYNAVTKLVNCILWGNLAGAGAQVYSDVGSLPVSYCDIQGGYVGTKNINTDPLFFRSPNAGADGVWGTGDDDYGDVRLRLTSPAIDAGNNAEVPPGTTLDLSSNPRFQNIASVADTGSGTAPIVDMGAFEAQATVQAVAGGPYGVSPGAAVQLLGSGFSDRGLALTYSWDLDNDGLFDDASVANPVFSAAGIQVPATLTVALRVSDSSGASAIDRTSIIVLPPIYVDDSATGANNGTSWADAYTSLQKALAAARSFQAIFVAQGTYKPTTGSEQSASFQLRNRVTIYGGYAGFGAANPDARDIAGYPSILSGDIGVAGSAADNSYHVLTASNVDASAILDGFIITAGNATNRGGGLYCQTASPTLVDCTFTGNSARAAAAYDGGGAIYNSSSSPTLVRCTFTGNSATGTVANSGGAAIYNYNSSTTLIDCTFVANSAPSTDVYTNGGGAIYNYSSTSVLTGCIFKGNTTAKSGGAIYNYCSPAAITNCVFVGNSGSSGGAIYNQGSSSATFAVTLTQCTIVGNAVPSTGSAVQSNYKSLQLVNCIVWGNTTGQLSGVDAVTYSDVQGGYVGTGNIKLDPFFVRNPSAGYDAKWGTADDDYGDLRPRLISPAIDAGSNAAVPAGVVTDIAGNPRFQDIAVVKDTGSGTAPIVDMGAYEAPGALMVLTGGPYTVTEGEVRDLSGMGYSDKGRALSYAWDLDGDGLYDDASGANAAFSAAGLRAPLTLDIGLKVIDSEGVSATERTTITIVPPIYVDDAATGANTGTSWADAFTSLQSALQLATPGRIIRVAQGTYKPTTDSSRLVTFQLKHGVSVFGGYAGFGAADPDARDLGRYPTILSGDIGVIGVSTDNSYHVVTGSGTDASDILDGFTITGGYADASGGGMYNAFGSPTIRNCNFIGNRADRSGGGMYNSGSSPTLVNCTFTANVAAGSAATMSDPSTARSGGGIENVSGSSPTLINCTFVANSVRSGNVTSGNAINSVNSLPTLVNCIVWGSASDGAPIGGPANITYSDIQGGWAGVGNINVDPQFVSVPSPGFDEVWGTADDCPGDVRLRLDSPAIDAGNTTAVPAGTMIDVAGNSRFQDIVAVPDTGVASAPIVDMGAYEAVPALMATAGGPYTVLLGNSIRLSGAGYSEQGLALSYAWDLNGDGVYDDALTPDPLFTATAGGMHYVALRVTDSNGIVAIDRAGVWVERMIYVDDSATGANTGAGWADAFTSLQSALANANPGDVIRVAGGTYKPTENADRSATFQLKNGVAIYGGYAGCGATDPDTRDIARYPTVLSGDIGVVGVVGDNSLNVVTAIDVNATVTLDGFTITAGNSNSSGGGLYCAYATPTVRNCRFIDNSASASGGGLYASGSYLTLIDCAFIRNAAQAGGGIALVNHSSATLTNCQVNGNTAHEGGGIESASDSWPTLVNCTFIGNSAAGSGGAIYCDIASVKLINCALTANRAANGGAFKSNGRKSVAYNCILWADVAPTDPEYYYHDGTLEIDHCIVQDGHVGMNADPRFVRVPSPGVDAIWGTADDDYGDLRLRIGSPAIDAGNNASFPTDLTTDLAGGPRFKDLLSVPDIGSGTPPIVDIGAYEAQPTFQAFVGGPYALLQGTTLKLSGSGFSDLGLPLTYAWDLDGDGLFDDASVPDPVFSAVGLQGPFTINIALRVTNTAGELAIDRTTISILPPIYVDDSATGANTGASWADAYTSLQSALAVATAAQVIYVAQGIYKPTAGTDRSATFRLANRVAIFGGYAGVGAPDPNARDVARYVTILSGDIGVVGSNADNSYHVITGTGTDSTAVLDGFTITGGNANGASPDDQGGGMYNLIGSPAVRNCTFSGNCAGGLALDTGGGGVYNDLSSPTFVNCVFTGNSATASDSKRYGGAIYSKQSMPTLIDCSFTFNSALGGGALSGSAQLINCSFFGNSAEHSGGGIYALPGTTLTNCVFVGNLASTGGALSGSAQMINCTLASNFATYQGGAIEVGYGGSVVLSNCIVWGNNAPRDPRFYLQGSLNASYSDIQGGWAGIGNIDLDPLFFRTPSAGPDTIWGTADDDYGNLRLRLSSPAIDSGDNFAFPASLATDLIGGARFQDIATMADSGKGTAPIIDMGAYEARPVPSLYAIAGGPYYVLQGESVKLAGSGSSDLGLALSYAWDFDGDGLFDDAATPDPLFSSGGLRGPVTLNIAIRVTDTQGNSAIDRTVIRVVPPIYVDDSATGGNNGMSWSDAYTSLQSALAAATAGQVIYVAQGTYKPTGGADRSATFQLKNNVALFGGYAGVGAADPDARNIGAYPSILSGDLGGLYYNTHHVVTGSNTDSTAVLDGFTVRGGSGNQGGGMYNNMGNPTVRDCTFADNAAVGDYDAGGGGMYNLSSSPTLIRCRFLRNSVTYRNSDGGGAMYNVQSSPTLIDCEFDGNWAGEYVNYIPSGGAIFNWSSTPLLINCSFVGNAVYGSGGGGALFNRASTATLVNCTFVANVAGNALGFGSVLACDTSSVKMVNCVIWGNVGSTWVQSYLDEPIDVSYSDVQGGYTGTSNVNADPRFIRMPSPGPDGTWGTLDDDYGDLGLQVGSPVIHAGDNSAVPAGVTTDLRGNPRILGGKVDMGASEAVDPANSSWVSGKASVRIAGSRELELLRIDDQARVEITKGANAVVTIGTLLINGEGVLDVNDNTLVVSNVSEQEVAKLIRKGRATGTWAGTGIVSSAAKAKPFTGLAAVTSGDGQVLIRYTWNGDANLDGVIDAADYFLIDSGFITQKGGYRNGDFNYDGVVDAADYFLIDSAFIAQTGVLAAGKAPAQPEIAMVRGAEAASSWRPVSVLQQLFSVKPVL